MQGKAIELESKKGWEDINNVLQYGGFLFLLQQI